MTCQAGLCQEPSHRHCTLIPYQSPDRQTPKKSFPTRFNCQHWIGRLDHGMLSLAQPGSVPPPPPSYNALGEIGTTDSIVTCPATLGAIFSGKAKVQRQPKYSPACVWLHLCQRAGHYENQRRTSIISNHGRKHPAGRLPSRCLNSHQGRTRG